MHVYTNMHTYKHCNYIHTPSYSAAAIKGFVAGGAFFPVLPASDKETRLLPGVSPPNPPAPRPPRVRGASEGTKGEMR